MTFFLLLFVSAVLAFLGILLLKQELFFSLIENNQRNQQFLKIYGVLYLILAVLGCSLAFFNETMIALVFIGIMMCVSAIFSIQFSKKMRP